MKDFNMAHFYLLLLRNETVWNPLWKEILPAQNVLQLHTLVQASSPHGFLWGPCCTWTRKNFSRTRNLATSGSSTPLLYLSLASGWEPGITINLLQIHGACFHQYW